MAFKGLPNSSKKCILIILLSSVDSSFHCTLKLNKYLYLFGYTAHIFTFMNIHLYKHTHRHIWMCHADSGTHIRTQAHTCANKWQSIYSFLAIHSNKDQDISRKRLNATGWIPLLNPHFSNISWKRKFRVTTCWTAHPSQRTIIWSSRTTVTFPVDTPLPDPDSCMTLTCTVRYSQDCIWIGWSNPRPLQQTLLNTSLFALISWTAADLRETALLRYPGLARRGGGGRKKRRGREELHLSFILFFLSWRPF